MVKPPIEAAISSLLRAHLGRRFAFLLDAGDSARCSFAGSDPTAQLVVRRDGSSLLWRGRAWEPTDAEPLEAIGAFVEENEADARVIEGRFDTSTRVHARTVGYLAYELGPWIEDVPAVASDAVGAPLAVLSVYSRVNAFDPETGEAATLEMTPTRPFRKSDAPVPGDGPTLEPTAVTRDLERLREQYGRGFERIRRAISAGEIYQANLTRAIDLPFTDDARACYLRLRARQAVPYGAFLDLGTFAIVSNSPECFLDITDEHIATYPIKGTRPRSDDSVGDTAAVAALTKDPKELAEHVMIVDLERNDLGRVCSTGSVEVTEHARVLSLATVHHLVSKVRGRLRSEARVADILAATFPGGSVTGAPKIQAMRTIAEVEPTARGVYTGAIGGFNGARRAELSVAIRTAVVAGGRVVYGTGGGIVADSQLESEYEETVTKARAFLDSLAGPGIVGSRAPNS